MPADLHVTRCRVQDRRPIIEYATTPRRTRSRYPLSEWIIPLFFLLFPFLVAAIVATWWR